jgi:hypothetical protein
MSESAEAIAKRAKVEKVRLRVAAATPEKKGSAKK